MLAATVGGTTGTAIKSNASVAAGSTGGEASHKLTTTEMPKHTHTQKAHGHDLYVDASFHPAPGGANSSWAVGGVGKSGGTWTATAVNNDSGGDGAHNTMPPFIAVYIWERID